MGLIECPECKTQMSEYAERCPKCGYPNIRASSVKQKKIKVAIVASVITGIVICGLYMATRSSKNSDSRGNLSESSYSYKYDDYSNNNYSHSYSQYSTSKPDSSTIFKNLVITDAKITKGSHWYDFSCKVKSNNDFTVYGYFYLNLYDSNGSLLYNQLVSLSDVGSGDTVTCSTMISKDKFPTNYTKMDFSQASLAQK